MQLMNTLEDKNKPTKILVLISKIFVGLFSIENEIEINLQDL